MLQQSAPPVTATISGVTARYGLSRSNIYRFLRSGKIKGIKIGARTYIDLESVDAMIAAAPVAAFREIGKGA